MKKNEKQEKVALSQHLQLNQLEHLKHEAERALNEIEEANSSSKENIQNLDDELSSLTGMFDELSNEELELLSSIDDEEIIINEWEIKSKIRSRYNLPQLPTIDFKDFDSLDFSSSEYLKLNSLTTNEDPLFLMLEATEVKEVLTEYKDKYGDVIPDAYDYGIMTIAGLVGLVCNTFFENKSKYAGTQQELIHSVGTLIISNSKFKEIFFQNILFLKEHIRSKINLDITDKMEKNPFLSKLFSYMVSKHIEKIHQKNETSLTIDLESKNLNLETISPSQLINLCVDDSSTQKVIALIDISPSELDEYIESFKFEDIDLGCLTEVIFSATDIVSMIEAQTGINNLTEIIDGFLIIYDLVSGNTKFNQDVYEQLQRLISKIIDDSGDTMNLKKPIEWVKNQISFDLTQLVHSVYEQFEVAISTENYDQLTPLIINNEVLQNQLIELLQKEVNKKDFSIHVFGEKIEVFNDLIKEETFLIELSQLLVQFKTSSSSSEDIKVMDLVQKWSVEKVMFILQHNQVLNFKLISDLSVEDFIKYTEILKIDFSSIKETGIGFFLAEAIIKLWVVIRDNKSIADFKQEPFAVKSSYLLCGAHLISNTKGFIDLAVSKNPSNINYNTLKMSIQYGFKAYNESLKRDQQIEADFNETLNNIYLNSF
jgi:hypothetical protein